MNVDNAAEGFTRVLERTVKEVCCAVSNIRVS